MSRSYVVRPSIEEIGNLINAEKEGNRITFLPPFLADLVSLSLELQKHGYFPGLRFMYFTRQFNPDSMSMGRIECSPSNPEAYPEWAEEGPPANSILSALREHVKAEALRGDRTQ